jgi:hypothetical protein
VSTPFTADVVRCVYCGHGIDPHGVDPGGACGVGDESGRPCDCLWSPNDVAAAHALIVERRRARATSDDRRALIQIVRQDEGDWKGLEERIADAVLAAGFARPESRDSDTRVIADPSPLEDPT